MTKEIRHDTIIFYYINYLFSFSFFGVGWWNPSIKTPSHYSRIHQLQVVVTISYISNSTPIFFLYTTMGIRKEKIYECCKTIAFILLILTIPVSVCRPLTGEKAGGRKYATEGLLRRALVPPSGPSPCTYIPGNGEGGHCPIHRWTSSECMLWCSFQRAVHVMWYSWAMTQKQWLKCNVRCGSGCVMFVLIWFIVWNKDNLM